MGIVGCFGCFSRKVAPEELSEGNQLPEALPTEQRHLEQHDPPDDRTDQNHIKEQREKQQEKEEQQKEEQVWKEQGNSKEEQEREQEQDIEVFLDDNHRLNKSELIANKLEPMQDIQELKEEYLLHKISTIGGESQAERERKETILLCHSRCRLAVKSTRFQVVTEKRPNTLSGRSEVFRHAVRCIVLVDYHATKSVDFEASLSFIKVLRKPVFATKLDSYFNPTGSVAAICKAYGTWFNSWDELAKELKVADSFTFEDADTVELENSFEETKAGDSQESEKNEDLEQRHDLFFSACEDEGKFIAKHLEQDVLAQGSFSHIQRSTGHMDRDMDLIKRSKLVVFVITEGTAWSSLQLIHLEAARSWKRQLLPIKREGVPLGDGWLSLALAGKLYYEVDPSDLSKLRVPFKENPNSPIRIADSTPAIEMLRAAQALMLLANRKVIDYDHLFEERNKQIVSIYKQEALAAGVEEEEAERICNLLDVSQASSVLEEANAAASVTEEQVSGFPPAVELLPAQQALQMTDIRYTITRLEHVPPQEVCDEFGIPIPGLMFDLMISYEWGSQEQAIDYFFQLRMQNVKLWFDVMGNMQGNMNAAMAAAVESAACLLVLLSERYEKSINCRLELEYAVSINKPVVFLCLPAYDVLSMAGWIKEIIGEPMQVYPAAEGSAEVTSKYLVLQGSAPCVRGVPLPNVIATAVRRLAQLRNSRTRPCRDATPLLFLKTRALISAAASASETSGMVACSRCKTLFNPLGSSEGKCRKYSSYYMGGTIMAGRWVCCNDNDKDGPGCTPCSHMAEARTWTLMQGYGTHTWEPA